MDMSQHPTIDTSTVETYSKADAAEARATTQTYIGISMLVASWAVSTALFGVAGFYLPAVAAVPLIFMVLVRITLG